MGEKAGERERERKRVVQGRVSWMSTFEVAWLNRRVLQSFWYSAKFEIPRY